MKLESTMKLLVLTFALASALPDSDGRAAETRLRESPNGVVNLAATMPQSSLYASSTGGELAKAGFPHTVSRWARPSDVGDYGGYYVGGGANRRRQGRGPLQHEGTWGWDYVGRVFSRRVALGWWRTPKNQAGVGAYSPDGPLLLQSRR